MYGQLVDWNLVDLRKSPERICSCRQGCELAHIALSSNGEPSARSHRRRSNSSRVRYQQELHLNVVGRTVLSINPVGSTPGPVLCGTPAVGSSGYNSKSLLNAELWITQLAEAYQSNPIVSATGP